MTGPGQAATGPQQAMERGEAAPASLPALFAEAAVSAEGGIAVVLDVYGEARRRFSAAQRDAVARGQLRQACLPAVPLLDTLRAHVDSANLDLCADVTHPCPTPECTTIEWQRAHHIDGVSQLCSAAHCMVTRRPLAILAGEMHCPAESCCCHDRSQVPSLCAMQEPRRGGAQWLAACRAHLCGGLCRCALLEMRPDKCILAGSLCVRTTI